MWQNIIWSVIGIIATGLASWGIAKLTALVDSKIGDTNAKNVLNSAINVVTDVVKQVYQTYVEALKNKNAFDKEAQETALSMAITSSKKLISENAKSFIVANYGDMEAWLTTQIEAVIYSLKNENTTFEIGDTAE